MSSNVNECKPLAMGFHHVPTEVFYNEAGDDHQVCDAEGEDPTCSDGEWQGLTLLHFSAQLEPCLSRENTLHTLHTP